ncbi:hypothetical protein [Microseira sp. BLCC-F43]|jgi:hypothetical protein|uniref:hypothetical protein n=1 Tax=Microseira sp. BLCC-F43 TaxID=3153602 RepID=UPI0035B941CA
MSYSHISEEVKTRVRTQARNQCGYCLSLQKYVLGLKEQRSRSVFFRYAIALCNQRARCKKL